MKKNYIKSKNHAFELYTDNPFHMSILSGLDLLLPSLPRYVAHFYILHDKCVVLQCDIDDDILNNRPPRKLGEKKKAHYHVLVIFSMQRPSTVVAKEVFNDKNVHVETVGSRDAYLQYLTHEDCKSIMYGKLIYPRLAVHMSDTEMYTKALNKIDMPEDFSKQDYNLSLLYDFIDDSAGYLTTNKLIRFSIEMGISEYLRRNYSMLKDLLYEHNLKFKDDKEN